MKALILNCSPVKNGATAEICNIAVSVLKEKYTVDTACIDDYSFSYCKGCRVCHNTAKCVQRDDVEYLMRKLAENDILVLVSPSYWGDVPGQFKAFIDRCTPWCNTHEPYAELPRGKKGYCITLRTGSGIAESERVASSIEHFYGHLNIEAAGKLCLTNIEYRMNVEAKRSEIIRFCGQI